MLPLQSALWVASLSTYVSAFQYPSFFPEPRKVAHGLTRPITKTYVGPGAEDGINKFLATYTTRTWKIEPFPTDTQDPYGSNAYKALWSGLNITQSELRTVVEPTQVAVNELTYPPTVPTVQATKALKHAKFNSDFVWGVASSAQQCEGAPQADGSGPSLMDGLFHGLLGFADNSDLSALNYYLYKEDIARLAAAGVQSYSFSIKWSRVVPFGKHGSPINEQAVAHYLDLIKTCRQYGVNPIITLTHFDTPAAIASPDRFLADKLYGGFNAGYDQETFVEDYLYYAKYIVAKFGPYVNTIFTFNEPQGVSANIIGARNVQLAHAKLYHFYHEVVQGAAEITLKQTILFAIPYNASSASDVAAADRQNEFSFGLFSNAAFLHKNLPDSAIKTVNNATEAPLFTPEELQLINGTMDFFAVDTYTAQFTTAPDVGIEACAADRSNVLWPICANATTIDPYTGYLLNGVGQPGGLTAGPSPTALTPQLERLWLKYIDETYHPAGGIMVAELGYAANTADDTPIYSQITDNERAEYLTENYEAILASKYLDKVNIRGILTWSSTDNWEFGNYKQRFGVQYVDFESPNKTRTYKTSFFSMLDFFERFA